VSALVKEQLDQTKIAQTIGRENIFVRTEKIGEPATQAWDAAQKWLAEQIEPDLVPEEVEQAEVETTHQKGFFGRIAQIWKGKPDDDSDEAPPPKDEEDRDADKH
jgi:hypothetical protein